MVTLMLIFMLEIHAWLYVYLFQDCVYESGKLLS